MSGTLRRGDRLGSDGIRCNAGPTRVWCQWMDWDGAIMSCRRNLLEAGGSRRKKRPEDVGQRSAEGAVQWMVNGWSMDGTAHRVGPEAGRGER